MNLVDRVKNILITPVKEWGVINGEPQKAGTVTTSYLLPLLLLGAAAVFIGFGLIGVSYWGFKVSGVGLGLKMAIAYIIRTLLSVFVIAFIIDALAPSFGSEKNFDKSFQLAAYSFTPALVAAVLYIIPALSILVILASLYAFYLLYIGIPILKKTPEDKRVVYFVVAILVAIVIGFILTWLQNRILYPRPGFGDIGM